MSQCPPQLSFSRSCPMVPSYYPWSGLITTEQCPTVVTITTEGRDYWAELDLLRFESFPLLSLNFSWPLVSSVDLHPSPTGPTATTFSLAAALLYSPQSPGPLTNNHYYRRERCLLDLLLYYGWYPPPDAYTISSFLGSPTFSMGL